MRTIVATLAVAIPLLTTIAAPAAEATPARVNVRIEGRTETLFEGPVLTDGHNVRAAESDPTAPSSARPCDGTNGGRSVTPGPTPTAASVDAMSIIGEGFDGQWYPGFDDYFLKRWGPDAQDPAAPGGGAYWGVLVNNVFTSVGGCQYELDEGDEVLWIYDAFTGRPTLALFPEAPAYASGPRPLTATAQLGVPFAVEVVSYEDGLESVPPDAPGRSGSIPYEGAEVAPVLTGPDGFERVDTADGATQTTGVDGKAAIVFDTAGWHRIKATVATVGGESAIRSNRLDVCVPAAGSSPPPAAPPLEGASDCAELPAADRVREADAERPGGEGSSGGGGGGAVASAPQSQPPTQPRPVRIAVQKLDRSDLSRGRIGLSWRVLSSGVGIRRWRVSSLRLGGRHTRYLSRATGTRGTSATLRLSPGATYRLRLTIVDVLGRSSSVVLGKVVVPPAGRA
jgi:hypothetical protein